MAVKTVTVFGSSMPEEGDIEYQNAYELGTRLGKAGLNVCTGGYCGIMDAVSKGATEQGREATGVLINGLNAMPSRYLTNKIECPSLLDRLSKLIETGNAYIVLNGGTGTLLEFSAIWEFMNKGIDDLKPAACCGEMWKGIVSIMDERMKYEGRETGMIKWFKDINECADYIIERLS